MAGIKDIFDQIGGILRALVELGLTIILVLIVLDILFGTTYVTANIATIVGNIAGSGQNGVAGVVALLLLLLLYQKK